MSGLFDDTKFRTSGETGTWSLFERYGEVGS